MNVWHIVTSEYPPDEGGVSNYTQQVAHGLARAGDEVHVWCPRATHVERTGDVHVHPELGSIGSGDLERLDTRLNQFPAPRRLLVQWVPHGFGYHSMNVWFCLWLANRSWRGDHIELMVHEPYLEFRRGPLRHWVMACVHRLMTIVLLASARKVWMSIPAWETRLRPYALGRRLPMAWLPVPGCLAASSAVSGASLRSRYAAAGQLVLGHFGTYGSAVVILLEERLPELMDGPFKPSLLLLGSGSDVYREVLVRRHPDWSGRVYATGFVPHDELTAHIAICDLFLQPYPDGVSSRRTSMMTCLSQGKPVVTTCGHLTEPLWAETSAVALAHVTDVAAFASAAHELLTGEDSRRALGLRGEHIYRERFSAGRVVETLRAA